MQGPSTPAKRAYDRTSHIMVVDDDQTLLKFFKIHLNKFFSRVIVVKNAKEAIDTMKTKEIDLVLSDINMPRVDGIQLLKKIRAHDASIPVYLISGALLDDDQIKEVNEIADGFLKKPFSVDEIQAFLDAGMHRRDLLKKLSEVVPDNKQLLSLVKGKSNVKEIRGKEKQATATELLDALKQAS